MSAPTPLTPEWLRAHPLPSPDGAGDKDARGRVLVVGGSRRVPGGVRLAAEAALRAGAGKLQVATLADLAPHLALAVPEALVQGLPEGEGGDIDPAAAAALARGAGRCDALLIGPGMLDDAGGAALVAALLEGLADDEGPAIVLDAAALTGVDAHAAALRRRGGRVVVTPHAGEMASLLGESKEAVEGDPLGMARRAGDLLGAVAVMKGAVTHVAAPGEGPGGGAWRYEGGGVGLATSGSGDVLAGLVAGLLARGAAPHLAALHAVHLHGEAGRRLARRVGPVGFLAREIAPEVPAIMAALAGEGGFSEGA